MIEDELDENSDVYRKLQQYFDMFPIGFPATESGVEIRLLKHLFTPVEAKIAMKLSLTAEPLNIIYQRVKKDGITIEELENILKTMFEKGSIVSHTKISKRGVKTYYGNALLAPGMFDYQVNRLTKDFVDDFDQYLEEAFNDECNKTGIPQLRLIPIEQSLTPEQSISTYDDLKYIIENSEDLISVSTCICRKCKDFIDEPCKKTELREICIQFGTAAQFYMDKGFGRQINKEELLKLMRKAEEDGLVLEVMNSKQPTGICCCCGCCCKILSKQKKIDHPSQHFATNFYAEVDAELCTGCGTCLDRCEMQAITLVDEKSLVNLGWCIGCGLCVPTCPSGAIILHKKKKETVPPETTAATYLAIMKKKAEMTTETKNIQT